MLHMRQPARYFQWTLRHRQLSSAVAAPGTPAAIITEALTKKVGGVVTTEPKQTLKEKFRLFWKNLFNDYKDVAVETFQESKAKPVKASFYLSLTGGLLYTCFTNPSENSYFAELTKYDTDMSFVSEAIRNPYAVKYMHSLLKQKMQGELHYQDFELFSIIWKYDASQKVGIYEAKCKYLKPLWSEFRERFVDIGFCGKWWMLDRRMTDYDVNPNEWDEELRYLTEDITAGKVPAVRYML